GALYLAVNALYIVSVVVGMAGPDEIRRPAVALQATASAATIAMAWSFYELLKPAARGLALLALLFRVAESALYGVAAIFSLLVLSGDPPSTPGPDQAALALAARARFASGYVGTVYFCAGSAIFFYLLFKGRFIPRTISGLGLLATAVVLAATLVRMAAPQLAGYVAFSDPLLLLAETATGAWLVVRGARSQSQIPSSSG
ncbi:MAG TPA: DUF4386 domain-containing protein, partial [Gammaproteobacteria bacterium]